MSHIQNAGLTDKFRPPEKKICVGCKTEKPLSEFNHSDTPDGRTYKCRACLKEIEEKKKADLAEYSKKYFTF